jgi:molecular chaperone GrpE
MTEATSENENEKDELDNVEPINTEVSANGEEATEEVTEETATLKEVPPEEDFKEKYYYLAADMDNLRKRFDREKQNLLKYGSEKILSGLLDVVDNLERTSDAIAEEEDEKIKNIYTGIEMVKKQFLDVLKTNGLEQVEALGAKFDPNIHEAMAGQPAPDKENDDIISEFQKGYTLNGRLLRAAKVIIVNND